MVFVFISGYQFRIVEMPWVRSQIKPRVDSNAFSSRTPLSNMLLINNFHRDSKSPSVPPPLLSPPPPPSSGGRISPAVLFIIVILAVIFFISGLLHLLVRFFTKHRRSSSPSTGQSSRYYPDLSSSDTYQRQLQQLFNLHDSGLDQAFIDALPVFHYKEIVGLKEPFDCAVCLCEFSDKDKLRLLPLCSHAFHISCIDTWLLSNSTCPLCRGALYSPGLAIENPVFDFDESREEDDGCGSGSNGGEATAVFGQKPSSTETAAEVTENQKRVFHVRLGKFRNTNNEVQGGGGDIEVAETSSSRLDARRCFSMGSYQYVVAESELQVALCPQQRAANGSELKGVKGRVVGQWKNRNFAIDGDTEGKRIGNKNESFSVSKIWLWSNKSKFPSSSSNAQHMIGAAGGDGSSNTSATDMTLLPWIRTDNGP